MQYEVKFTLYPAHIAIIYLVIITAAELITAAVDPWSGIVFHAVVLIGMIFHTAFTWHDPSRRFLISLTFAPLIRILSLSLPLAQFPLIYWFLITSVPLFLALFLIIRTLGFSADRVGLNTRQWLLQLLIVPTGLLFGIAEYYILRPEPLISSLTWSQILIPALILLVSTGFFEEIAFRGIMQSTALETLGRFGLVYIALIFAVLHIGYLSVLDVAFVFAVGLFFGWVVFKTGSIIGVTFSHGLTNIMLFLVMPFLVTWDSGPALAALGQEEGIFIPNDSLESTTPTTTGQSNHSGAFIIQTATIESEAIFIPLPSKVAVQSPRRLSSPGSIGRIETKRGTERLPSKTPQPSRTSEAQSSAVALLVAEAAQTTLVATATATFTPENTATTAPATTGANATTTESEQTSPTDLIPSFSLLPSRTPSVTPLPATALPTAKATETPQATATSQATATAESTPTTESTATEVPTNTATNTVEPTATQTAEPTATPLPTATLTPSPTFTPLPTATPTATATPLLPVVAISPANGVVASEAVTFEWLSEQIIDADQRYELVFWQDNQQPLIDGVGLAVPSGATEISVNLRQLDLVLRERFEPGTYRWGLLLVQTEPQYERLSYLGGGHTLVFTE